MRRREGLLEGVGIKGDDESAVKNGFVEGVYIDYRGILVIECMVSTIVRKHTIDRIFMNQPV